MKRTILITGSTDGIGRQTALRIAQRGDSVILHGRNAANGQKIKEQLIQQTGNSNITYINADLTSFSEVEGMVEVLVTKKLVPHILINNAGIYQTNYETVTDKNIEKTFMVNYLAHFYLTYLLLPLMEEKGKPNIVNVASMVHARSIRIKGIVNPGNFIGSEAYSNSKLCNILFTKKLVRENPRIICNALHPGVIDTKLLRAGWGGGGSDLNSGADQLLYGAYEAPDYVNGAYLEYSNEANPASIAIDENVQDELHELSMQLIPK
jgi:NAD(P)-dependent dehydrogenase (short-subunit alcohol dehydrogenase family)